MALVRRNSVPLALACVATFISVILMFRDEGPGDASAEGTATAEQEVGGSTGVEAQVATPVEPGPSAYAIPGRFPAVRQVSTSSYEPAPESAELSGQADADARAGSIRDLDGAAKSESLGLLERIVQFDDVSRNRLLAVNSLRLMAKRGNDSSRILDLLRAAMADPDTNVATSARDAYREAVQQE